MIGASFALLALASPLSAPQDPITLTAEALERGEEAERAGDGRRLAEAARTLERLGARPAEGDDAARRWRRIARAQGVTEKPATYRGRVLGPAYRRGVLAAGAALSTEQVFLAGQKAVVSVVPQAGRKLAVRITDPGQASICELNVTARHASCRWIPVFTRRVHIRIVNPEDQPSHYYLVSN